MKKAILLIMLFLIFSLNGFAEDKAMLPVLMYHSVDEVPGNYSVTPQKLDMDIKSLKAQGYTPVFFEDVINFVYRRIPLPSKPIVITFDDGYKNNYTELFPIVKENNIKVELFGIAGAMEYGKTFLRAFEAKEMEQSGYFNFECHTYNLHNDVNNVRKGIGKLENESFRQWEHIFRQDLFFAKQFARNNLEKDYRVFAYPFGNFFAYAEKILEEEGYLVSVTTEPGINEIEYNNPDSLRLLMRISMDNTDITAAERINNFLNYTQSEKILEVKNTNISDYSTRAEALGVILGDVSERDTKFTFIDGYYDTKFSETETKKIMELAIEDFLISGYSDLSLRPGHYITRGEFALMLARHCKYENKNEKSSFTDVGDWNSSAIEFCNKKGYMIGYGENFGTEDFLTCEQLLIIKSRLKN